MARASVIHHSLHEVRLIANAPRGAAIMLWTVIAVMVMSIRHPYAMALVPIGMFIHKLLAIWTRNDPLRPRIYMVFYSRERDRYDPWPSVRLLAKSRPQGFGRGLLR